MGGTQRNSGMAPETFTDDHRPTDTCGVHRGDRVLDPRPEGPDAFRRNRIGYPHASRIEEEATAEARPVLLDPKVYRMLPHRLDARRPLREDDDAEPTLTEHLITHMPALRSLRIQDGRGYSL